MKEYYLIIDGKKIATEKTFDVINPAIGTAFAQAPDCSITQLNLAVEAAHRAFQSWRLNEPARRKALLACADILRSSAEELGKILTEEQGKTFQQAKGECE